MTGRTSLAQLFSNRPVLSLNRIRWTVARRARMPRRRPRCPDFRWCCSRQRHEAINEQVHACLRILAVQLLKRSPHDDALPVIPVVDMLHLEAHVRVSAHGTQLGAVDGVAVDEGAIEDVVMGTTSTRPSLMQPIRPTTWLLSTV